MSSRLNLESWMSHLFEDIPHRISCHFGGFPYNNVGNNLQRKDSQSPGRRDDKMGLTGVLLEKMQMAIP